MKHFFLLALFAMLAGCTSKSRPEQGKSDKALTDNVAKEESATGDTAKPADGDQAGPVDEAKARPVITAPVLDCKSDEDCGTFYPTDKDGTPGCCGSSCYPVQVARKDWIELLYKSCGDKPCPPGACPPPKTEPRAACREALCALAE